MRVPQLGQLGGWACCINFTKFTPLTYVLIVAHHPGNRGSSSHITHQLAVSQHSLYVWVSRGYVAQAGSAVSALKKQLNCDANQISINKSSLFGLNPCDSLQTSQYQTSQYIFVLNGSLRGINPLFQPQTINFLVKSRRKANPGVKHHTRIVNPRMIFGSRIKHSEINQVAMNSSISPYRKAVGARLGGSFAQKFHAEWNNDRNTQRISLVVIHIDPKARRLWCHT